MKARLEEAILGTIGARQEMVRRSRGEVTGELVCGAHLQSQPSGKEEFKARPQLYMSPCLRGKRFTCHCSLHGCMWFSYVPTACLCLLVVSDEQCLSA